MTGQNEADRSTGSSRVDRRAVLRAGVMGGVGIGLAAVLPASAAAASATRLALPRERAATAFLDSLGVVTHWDYPDTPYGFRYAATRDALVGLGVRHIRTTSTAKVAELGRLGVRTMLSLEPVAGRSVADVLGGIEPLVRAGFVDAIEGPNEPDLFWSRYGRTYRGAGFPAGVVAWQRDVFRAVRARPSFDAVTVVGPTLGRTYWGSANPYGTVGELADAVDVGAFHPYPGGNPFNNPFPYNGVPRYYWQSDFPSTTLDRYPINFRSGRQPYGEGFPMWATETGYSTFVNGPSESLHAAYTVRLLLENYRLGIGRSYLYELADEFVDPGRTDREANFGLLRRDGTPKPAYSAVKGLQTVLQGRGRRRTTPLGTAGMSLTLLTPDGIDPGNVHQMLLRRADGSLVLAVWHEVTGSNYQAGFDRPPAVVNWPLLHARLALPRGVLATQQTFSTNGTPTAARGVVDGGLVSVSERVTLLTLS